MNDERPRFLFWQRCLRRLFFGHQLTHCVRCKERPQVGPDLLCEECLADPDVRENWIDDD